MLDWMDTFDEWGRELTCNLHLYPNPYDWERRWELDRERGWRMLRISFGPFQAQFAAVSWTEAKRIVRDLRGHELRMKG